MVAGNVETTQATTDALIGTFTIVGAAWET
jgi:hypothetical protein